MTDRTADQKKNKTQKRPPAKIDHANLYKLTADNSSDKMTGEKTGYRNQNIYKYGKYIAACN